MKPKYHIFIESDWIMMPKHSIKCDKKSIILKQQTIVIMPIK